MARRKQPARPLPPCDLDELLYGTPDFETVKKFFAYHGETGDGFPEEHYLVDAIKKHLRTDEQRLEMADRDITIADMLNGRTTGEHEAFVDACYADWNTKLGRRAFGW